jgi:hypothetical protein
MKLGYCPAACGVLLALLAQTSLAQATSTPQWHEIGHLEGANPGTVYIALDSIHEEDGYRIATFLTVYAQSVSNPYGVTMDRFTQKTAFDCQNGTVSLIMTLAYYRGKAVGSSHNSPDWRAAFKAIPPDVTSSQQVYQFACNAIPVQQPTSDAVLGDSAATVSLSAGEAGTKAPPSVPAPH